MFSGSNLSPFTPKKAAFVFTNMGLHGHLSAEYIFYLSRRKKMHMNPHAATLIKGESQIEPDVARGQSARTSVNISPKFFGENRVIKSRVTR